jgi:hypothetical protein
VDKHFYGDKGRGQVVGVCGNDCLDIEAALEKVRKYVDYESTLDGLHAFGETSGCWEWLYKGGELVTEWVTEKLQEGGSTKNWDGT